MKKIMFNDQYGLTQAVLSGRKTMTRRVIKFDKLGEFTFTNALKHDWGQKAIQAFVGKEARYKVGEVVAIAQSYRSITEEEEEINGVLGLYRIGQKYLTMDEMGAGWSNKMFTRADLMPHHICITDIKVERLQDITPDECLKEGIYKGQCGSADTHFMDAYYYKGDIQPYCTPREAFAALIDKVSGKGVFQSNPYVFVYNFVLIK